jgi:hypothetical protein
MGTRSAAARRKKARLREEAKKALPPKKARLYEQIDEGEPYCTNTCYVYY